MPPEIAVVPPTYVVCSSNSTRCPAAAATAAAVSPAAPAPTTIKSASSVTGAWSHHATVGLHDLAVHPRGARRHDEGHRLGHLLRLAHAVERAQRRRARFHLVGLAGTEQLGVDRSRRDRVHADA